MEYLKKYGVTEEQIHKIEDKYNEGILDFIKENEEFVEDTIKYLYSENIKCIYLLMINNIRIFLETQITLQRKIEEMKRNGLKTKQIQMKLLEERQRLKSKYFQKLKDIIKYRHCGHTKKLFYYILEFFVTLKYIY